jgi:2,3-bisphosphoglycerate-dependent phosphoglycerate mutase/probable phosphoglycerate mutase
MSRVTRHTDIWLVRHTQTDWNRERRYQSRSDRPLTAFGHARVAAVADRLRRTSFSAVITSGQMRTDTLAEAVVAQQTRTPALRCDERWREADHGDWEGLTYADVTRCYAAQAHARFADPWNSRAHGSESTADLWGRVQAGWHDLLRRHDGGRILVVTHATPIQLLLCGLLKLPFAQYWQFRIDLGGVTNLDLYPSGMITRVLNEVPPLQGERELRTKNREPKTENQEWKTRNKGTNEQENKESNEQENKEMYD